LTGCLKTINDHHKKYTVVLIIGRKILGAVGIDGAIAFTILTRLIQAGGGVISIFVIAKFLTPDEQGYYYTFASILAIQVFFELGLSGIITQYTAYEFAHLSWSNNDLSGADYYKSRLSSLLRFCVKWFAILAILLCFILVGSGYFFFKTYNRNNTINWQNPWILLCVSTALNLFIDPVLAFFDGLGEVKDMSKVRLIQKTIYVFLLFLFFFLGFKLYSSAIASLVSISINYIQIIFSKRISFLKAIWVAKGEATISYFHEIFPFQWKIALSWISGYFIFQLFNPILFASEGPVVAGQMGLTLQALNGITTICASWIGTKVPLFSGYISQKNYTELDKLFDKTLMSMIKVCVLLLGIFNIGVLLLNYWGMSYAHRFLPLVPTIILSLTCFVMQITYAWATYLRCHKEEPFLIQSVVMAVLCCISIVIASKAFGLIGIVTGYGFLVVFVSFIWSFYLFKTKKSEWHKISI
jgi:O-antigen/teichoic acid export membrane protein